MRSTSQQFQIGPPITHIDSIGHGTAYGPRSTVILGTDAEPFEFISGAIKARYYHVDATGTWNHHCSDANGRGAFAVPACGIETSRRPEGPAPGG